FGVDGALAAVGEELTHHRRPGTAALSELVEQRLQLPDVGQAHGERIVERPLGAGWVDERHDVEDRPRWRRDGDVIDDRAMVRKKEAGLRWPLLEVTAALAILRADFDRCGRKAGHLPERGSRQSSDDRPIAGGEDCRQQILPPRPRRRCDPEDAAAY